MPCIFNAKKCYKTNSIRASRGNSRNGQNMIHRSGGMAPHLGKERGHNEPGKKKRKEEKKTNSSVWTLFKIPNLRERMMLIVHCIPADRRTHKRGQRFRIPISPVLYNPSALWSGHELALLWGASPEWRGGHWWLASPTPIHPNLLWGKEHLIQLRPRRCVHPRRLRKKH